MNKSFDYTSSTGYDPDEYNTINEFSINREYNADGLYIRDYNDAEAEEDEFFLIASGKYAKKMRQLFSSFESELAEVE